MDALALMRKRLHAKEQRAIQKQKELEDFMKEDEARMRNQTEGAGRTPAQGQARGREIAGQGEGEGSQSRGLIAVFERIVV